MGDALGLDYQSDPAASSDVVRTLYELAASGLLWTHLSLSLGRLAVGAFLGAGFGVLIGVGIGLSSYMRAGLVPLVAALFPIPKIALLPLFVIWFGIDEVSKYALIAFGTFTPTVVATYGAVDNVDRTLIRMGQSFGLTRASIIRKIVLAGAMPWHPVWLADFTGDCDHFVDRSRDDWRANTASGLHPASRCAL